MPVLGWGCLGADRGVGASGGSEGLHLKNEDVGGQVNWTHDSTALSQQMPLPGGYVWAQVNQTQISTALGH